VGEVRPGPVGALVGQIALLAILARTVGLTPAGWAAGLAVGAAVAALLSTAMSRAGRAHLGTANRVTLARAVLVGGIAALVAGGFVGASANAALVALATPALLLDAIDGWLARRTGTVSDFGARFDMEVDALLILVLSIDSARNLGPWVLAIGAARYLLAAAGLVVGWLRATAPARPWGKIVAAVQGVTLTVVCSHVLPHAVAIAAVAVALALLTESFGHQVAWLWRHERMRPVRLPAPPLRAVPVPVRR
jgi:phosphatidylglycerophosphate synthase